MTKQEDAEKFADELYAMNYQIEQLNARLLLVGNREQVIARYTEYIAGNLDFLISYVEHLAEVYSSNISMQNLGDTNLASQKRAPTFEEYKAIRGFG